MMPSIHYITEVKKKKSLMGNRFELLGFFFKPLPRGNKSLCLLGSFYLILQSPFFLKPRVAWQSCKEYECLINKN